MYLDLGWPDLYSPRESGYFNWISFFKIYISLRNFQLSFQPIYSQEFLGFPLTVADVLASLGSAVLEQALGREKAYFMGSECLFTLKSKGLAVSCCKQQQIIWTDRFLFVAMINAHVHTHTCTHRHTGTCTHMHELFGSKSEKKNEGGMRLAKVNGRKITPLGLGYSCQRVIKGFCLFCFVLFFRPPSSWWKQMTEAWFCSQQKLL